MREFTFLKNPIKCKCGNMIPAQGYRYKGICVNCYMRKWRSEHKESVRQSMKKYYDTNKKEILKQRTDYLKQYYEEKPWKRLLRNIGKSLRSGRITWNHLHCTKENYIKKIEGLFVDGLSWDNYGTVWYLNRIRKIKYYGIDNIELIVKKKL